MENNKKPMSILLNEFKANIINNVNKAGLPLYLLYPILKDILNDVASIASQQEEQEKTQYEQTVQAEIRSKSEENNTDKEIVND